jgi:lysophospholipase L1-like esterase
VSQADLRAEPFRVMVALGESHVAGAGASQERLRWVNVVADLLTQFQGQPVTLYNSGISANAISPRSPGYQSSAKPSALERYREHVVAHDPDLFLLAYGLNDMRAGMPPEDFREDMQTIMSDVKAACHPVTVLTTVYHMSAYDLYPPYDRGSPEATEMYNEVIRQLARKNDCLLADIYAAEGCADWLIHPDTVHANDIGHRLIGHRVFEVIANHCSGAAAAVTRALADARVEVERTMADRRSPRQYG